MRRKSVWATLLCLAVVAILAMAAAPASAITYGALDGDLHPNVGAIVAEVPAGPWANGFVFDGGKTAVASGTLIAPRVFLTAGHVVAILESMGVTQVWVTFDPVFVRGVSNLIPGTMHANPNFRWTGSNANDVAVITFAQDVTGIPLAKLPTARLLDQMTAANGLHGQSFTEVGYGMQERTVGGGTPMWGPSGERRVATATFNALTPAYLHLCMNPVLGDGGTSMFDSGGPNFIGTSNVIAATTTGGDAATRAMGTACRLDTPEARTFLGQYVTLP